MPEDFIGAKAALLCEGRLLTYLRDDKPGLPWAGWWDLPGGGREGMESPEECLIREVEEEFGLRLETGRLTYRRVYPAMTGGPLPGVFFAAVITRQDIAAIRFGDEGQRWEMMRLEDFAAHPLAIPALVKRVLDVPFQA